MHYKNTKKIEIKDPIITIVYEGKIIFPNHINCIIIQMRVVYSWKDY